MIRQQFDQQMEKNDYQKKACSLKQQQKESGLSSPEINSTKKRIEVQKGIIFQIDPQYKVEKVIGIGVYGVVCLGQNLIRNQPVAIKKVSGLFKDLGDTKRILRQMKILKFLKHPNIVTLLDIMKVENQNTFSQIYLCMQFMQITLRGLINSKLIIDDRMTRYIMFQILHGVYYMHSADILHRDLKPQNILMNRKCALKIADMNLARKEGLDLTLEVVSRAYRAPQIFLTNTYTKAIDIWSAGCILAELLGRTVLFEGKTFVDQIKKFLAVLGKPKMQLYKDVDPVSREGLNRIIAQTPDREKVNWTYLYPKANVQALDLLDKMLSYDFETRFTAEQCLNHPYFEELKNANPIIRCQNFFDSSFDKQFINEAQLRSAIYRESEEFQVKPTRKIQSQKQYNEGLEPVKKVKID